MAAISKTTFRPSIVRMILGEIYLCILINFAFLLGILLYSGLSTETFESMLRSITCTQPILLLLFTIPWYYYNTINIYETKIEGPSMYGMFWRKVIISVTEVIPEDKGNKYLYSKILFGHVLLSSKGERINILWLEKGKVERIIELITQLKLE